MRLLRHTLVCHTLLALAVAAGTLAVSAPAAVAAEGLTVAAVEPAPWLLGRNTSSQWHVTVTNGGADPATDVAPAWDPLPPAVSMSVSPPSATIPAGGTQSYTLAVTTGAAPFGDHPVTFTAASSGGTATGSGTVSLRVADVPGAPTNANATAGDTTATVTWDAAAPNGSAVLMYRVTSPDTPAFAEVAGTATSAVVSGLANGGSYRFLVRAVNELGAGPDSALTGYVTPAAPEVPPPVASVAALPPFATAPIVRLAYSATGGTGVAVFDVRYRAARHDAGFGAYQYPDTWQATEAAGVTRTLARGYTYCFSVRAWDERDLAGEWSAERCTAVPLDDRALTASGAWTRGTSPGHYAGTFSATHSTGATLTRTGVRARRVALLATRCAGCGTVGIYLDGVLVRKITLAATATRYRQLFAADLGAVRAGTFTVRALGTGRVYVDGLAVSRA